MQFAIDLKFSPSPAFMGILAELNGMYSGSSDGSYDWADQTRDFLRAPQGLPQIGDKALDTPLTRKVLGDVLNVAIAMFSGDFNFVRRYLAHTRFAFVIGYPRSGGSYLTKELLRTIGLEHTKVSEELAHDGFPDLRDVYYLAEKGRPFYFMQDSIFQVAEFLVIANVYYQLRSKPFAPHRWLIPKKFHKMANWAGSLKMLLGKGGADYILTVRNPLAAALSIADKSGGMPDNNLFPATTPRSAIEYWVLHDLMMMGHNTDEIAKLPYVEAILKSWVSYYSKVATNGLFLGDRDEVKIVPYERTAIEGVVQDYNNIVPGAEQRHVEPFMLNDKAQRSKEWHHAANDAQNAVATVWDEFGLKFPDLAIN